MANTRRENRIEELGRVDAEHAETSKGKKNLWAEKKRIRKELKAKTGTMVKAKQGYYDKEDESIGMRLGKGKATKKNKKKAKKERDESYGDWGKRSKDWKTKKAKTGTMVKAKNSALISHQKAYDLAKAEKGEDRITKADIAYQRTKHIKGRTGRKHATGSMIKAKKGWGKKIAKAAAIAGAAYLGSKMRGPKLKGTNVLDYEGEAAGLHSKKSYMHDLEAVAPKKPHKPHKWKKDIFSDPWGAKTGKMVKARGSVFVRTKIGKNRRTLTF
jgi:hypothetical protein